MINETLRLSWEGIKSHKLRSFLSMLGVTIGVFAVVALISLGQSVNHTIKEQFQVAGSNFITVNIAGGNDNVLTYEAAMELQNLSRVKRVAPVSSFPVVVSYNNNRKYVLIQATTPEYEKTHNINNKGVEVGRFLEPGDIEKGEKVAIVESETVDNLFLRDNSASIKEFIGKEISADGYSLNVIGIMEGDTGFPGGISGETVDEKEDSSEQGEQGEQGEQRMPFGPPDRSLSLGASRRILDDNIIIPISTARELFGVNQVTRINAQAEDLDSVEEATAAIEAELEDYFGNDKAFSIFSQDQILDLVDSIMGTITNMLAGLAGISLLVGGIGIMNIMLVSVTERTREIGISKALGAKKRDILRQFLLESVMISGIGGMVGIILSYIVVRFITLYANFNMVFTIEVIIGAVLFSMLVGVFFGIYPANKAANLHPIDALRSE